MCATELGWSVAGWDVRADHAESAQARGAIATIAPSAAALARSCDVLVLATPLDATLALLRDLVASPPAAALTLDVASVKAPVAEAARGLAGFVATHPIAGSERSGPGAARADLFAGRTWTVDADAPDEARSAAEAFVRELGAQPLAIGNAEHDRTIALTSHLPQLLSVALGMRLAEIAGAESAPVSFLSGTGMRSMLRLAASAWSVWGSVLGANASPVAQEVRRLTDILSGIADALEADRPGALADDFAAAARAVARLGEIDGDRANVGLGSTDER